MNSKQTPISDDDLMLLADGELSQSSREELIHRIDAANDWKRCAIFFLQTQTLGSTLGAIQAELHTTASTGSLPSSSSTAIQESGSADFHSKQSIGATPKTPKHITKETPVVEQKRAWPQLAIAASFLVVLAFAGGLFFGGRGLEKPDRLADQTVDNKNSQMQWPITTDSTDRQQHDPKLLTQIHSAVDSIGVADSKIVALVKVNLGSSQEVFPLIRSDQLSQQLQKTTQPRIPTRIANQMRRSGWQVQSSKHFVSVNLPDGKSQTFPIGMLNYKFIGNPVF